MQYISPMASLPARALLRDPAPATATREVDVRRPKDEQRRVHRERVRASLAWALHEYRATLAKLAK